MFPHSLQRICHNFVFLILFFPILNALGRPETLSKPYSFRYAKRAADLHDLQELFAQQPPHCSRATVSVGSPSICEFLLLK